MTTENDFEQLFVDGNWRCCWSQSVVTECVFEKQIDTDALGHQNWRTDFVVRFRNNTGAYQISGDLNETAKERLNLAPATTANLILRAVQELQRIDLPGEPEEEPDGD